MEKQEQRDIFVFLPADQRVLVKPDENQENKLRSGLLLPPDSESNKAKFGVVIEAGPGDPDNPMRYKKGAKVVFSDYAGINIALDIQGTGLEFYKVMDQRDIMGTLVKCQKI